MLAQINAAVAQHGPGGVASSLVMLVGWIVRHLATELVSERAYSRQLAEQLATANAKLALFRAGALPAGAEVLPCQ